jgi:hypothetical protein
MAIKVELDGDEIVVTKPGTDFLLAYRKRSDSPNLVLARGREKPTVTSTELGRVLINRDW